MRRLLVLFALSLMLRADDRWVETHSGPFQVLSNSGDKLAREQMMKLEQFRQALGIVLGKQDLQLIWPVRVVLLKGGMRVEPRFSRDSYICTDPALDVLARLLIDQNTKRLPAEIETGIIELFSTLEVDGTHVTLGAPLRAAARTRDWARMHLLTVDPAYSGRARVLISNLEQGSDLDAAYKNAFEKTAAQIEKQVDSYLATGTFGTTNISGRPINPLRDFHVVQIESGAAKLAMADLLLVSRAQEAEGAYTALHGPAAAEGLGLVALKANRGQEARPLFQSAIDSGDAGARAWFEAGRLEPDAAKARPLLQKAAELNPRWPEPPYRLAEREDDLDRKAMLLAKAANLDPRNASYWQALAESYVKANRFKDAQKAWGGAETAAATSQERERIRQVRLQLEAQRADYEAAERKRLADEQARDLERVKNASMAEIHAAEAAANKKLNPDGSAPPKPVEWWNSPEAAAKVDGLLQRVDCVGRLAKLVIQTEDGKTLQLLVRDPAQMVLINGSEKSLGCGLQKPPRNISAGYNPKTDKRFGTNGEVVSVEFR